ncbi:MAG: radical SAM protein [Elusimicrobia bacterium]|nr:radical SAM protein [Elusimicrobiota bacterium]
MNILSRRKLWNYKLIEYQKKRGSSIVFGYPLWLTIDPSNICNLRCVFCPTGQQRGTRSQTIMPLGKFKKIIDTLGPYLFHIDFCNWGEPLLNKDLPEMVAYARRFGPSTKIDTNLNIDMSREDARRLIASGLDRLNISVDGASQQTYEKYRRGGDFEKVMRNMRLLTDVRREMKSNTPHIHWQFLVFKHNEHERESAKKMSHDIGVDSIGFTAPFCAPEWVSTIDEYNNYIKKDDNSVEFKHVQTQCNWLWDAITINADGSVSPCCSVEEQKDDFGNFFSKPFFFVWNNACYRKARRYIMTKIQSTRANICMRCDHIGASNHASIRRD